MTRQTHFFADALSGEHEVKVVYDLKVHDLDGGVSHVTEEHVCIRVVQELCLGQILTLTEFAPEAVEEQFGQATESGIVCHFSGSRRIPSRASYI